MKYIRTKDRILLSENIGYDESGHAYSKITDFYQDFTKKDIVAQADTIEELIKDSDILYLHDLYPDAVLVVEGNIKPFGYNEKIELKKWLDYKTKFDLYIRNIKGDYICVAKSNNEGKLELL